MKPKLFLGLALMVFLVGCTSSQIQTSNPLISNLQETPLSTTTSSTTSTTYHVDTLSLCLMPDGSYKQVEGNCPRYVRTANKNNQWTAETFPEKGFKAPTVSYDEYYSVLCDTDSMYPALQCGDVVFLKKVRSSTTLEVGKMYVFSGDNYGYDYAFDIVHRLIAIEEPEVVWDCDNQGCTAPLTDPTYIFKGDNNDYTEIIDREDIKYVVVGVWHG